MDNNKINQSELPEEEYNKQLNSLNSDINNLVSSLNNLLDKEKELLKMEAEKLKAKKITSGEYFEDIENMTNLEPKRRQRRKSKLKSIFKNISQKVLGLFKTKKYRK